MRGSIRVFMSDSLTMTLLPSLMRLLADEAPNLDLRVLVTEDKRRELDRLARGEAHLAVGIYSSDRTGLKRRLLWEDGLVLVARADHPLVGLDFGPEALADYPHLMQSTRGDDRGRLDARLAEHGLTRRVWLTTPYFASIARLVAHSDALAMLPARDAAMWVDLLDLAILPSPFVIPTFRVHAYWDLRYDADPLQRWVRDAVVRAAAGMQTPESRAHR